MLLVFIISCIILIFCVLKLYREKANLKLENENLKSHNKILQEMYDSVRSFKHDFSNFIQALKGYVETNDIEGIDNMCEFACNECKNVNTLSTLNSSLINNPAVYNLIANKYFLAQSLNIAMQIEINYDLHSLEIDTYRLCKILGILLDNAIEAAKECTQKIVNIKFYYDKATNHKYIQIDNTYQNTIVDMDRIFEKGYSTKNSSNEHGLGLWNIKKIIDRDDKIKLVTFAKEVFTQILQIY